MRKKTKDLARAVKRHTATFEHGRMYDIDCVSEMFGSLSHLPPENRPVTDISEKRLNRRRRNQANEVKKQDVMKSFNHEYEVQAILVRQRRLSLLRSAIQSTASKIKSVRDALKEAGVKYKLQFNTQKERITLSKLRYLRNTRRTRVDPIKYVYFKTYADYLVASMVTRDMFSHTRVKPDKT